MAEILQRCLEASNSTNWFFISPLDVVNIVEVENGERGLVHLERAGGMVGDLRREGGGRGRGEGGGGVMLRG